MERVRSYVKENATRYQNFLKELVLHESPTKNKEAVDACGEFLSDFCRAEGLTVEKKEFSGKGNYYRISSFPNSKEKPILLMGHIDTVHPIGAYDPVVKIDGNRLYGPGVFDCKGGVVAGLFAMKALSESGCTRPVSFLLSGAEEDCGFAGLDVQEYLTEESRGALACFNTEPYNSGVVTTSRKGIARAEVTVQGKASHAGSGYDKGISAIKEACHKILKIEEASDMQAVTYNCGVIQGGSVANTVPEFCKFIVDIRCPTLAMMEEAVERVKKICDESFIPGTKTTVVFPPRRPPMEFIEGTGRLLEFVNSVNRELGIEEVCGRYRGGGADSSYSVLAGVPTLCSCGASGDGGHTLQEYTLLDSVPQAAIRLAAWIKKLPADFC